MRRPRYYSIPSALPRMSWNPNNLFNLWQRSVGPHSQNKVPKNATTFKNYPGTLFKSRWQSKKLVRAYHCDYIPEKKFVRWWLPDRLPDPMERKHAGSKEDATKEARTRAAVAWARPQRNAPKLQESELAPISSLMFSELERRIDVVVFRSCFAPSIHAARQMVVHGWVTLNGLKESNPNTRLNPGDLVSVDPSAMIILRPPKIPSEDPAKVETTEEVEKSSTGSSDEHSDAALQLKEDGDSAPAQSKDLGEHKTTKSIRPAQSPKWPAHIYARDKSNPA
ncbi:mitochondrial 37S ribosomal protein nam9, partial [Tulasnella sp. 419]